MQYAARVVTAAARARRTAAKAAAAALVKFAALCNHAYMYTYIYINNIPQGPPLRQ
jgi:hypothetical protein